MLIPKRLRATEKEFDYYYDNRNRYPYWTLQEAVEILRTPIEKNPFISLIKKDKNGQD